MPKAKKILAKHIRDPFVGLLVDLRKIAVSLQLRGFSMPYRLHLGCGKVHFDGWINLDHEKHLFSVDVRWDLSRGLPFPDQSCEFIYCEHLLEQLPVARGKFSSRMPSGAVSRRSIADRHAVA